MRGELPKFFVTFSEVQFWSIKGLKNANNLNLKLFFRLYTLPTKKVFCLYLRSILDNDSFWMSLKTAFLTFKKSYTSYPNWGGGNLDKIQKKSNFFFVEPSFTNENWTAPSTASAMQGRQFAQNTLNGNCLNFQSSEHVKATALTHHLNKCRTETDSKVVQCWENTI